MAMTLPIVVPSPPAAPSPPSSDDSNPPRTPISPMQHPLLPNSDLMSGSGSSGNGNSSSTSGNGANNNLANLKRKPSRRANTAERRATHNAVERQRRETLNGRFLDLAGLLPNLTQIRRPSKSSIVNSSIAHIHASRRHRLLASRELRSLKIESDALRREINEWRDRAGIPRIDEPVRSEGFSIILSAELENIMVPGGMDEDEDGDDMYDGSPDGAPRRELEMEAVGRSGYDEEDEFAVMQMMQQQQAAQAQAQAHAHHQQQQHHHQQQPQGMHHMPHVRPQLQALNTNPNGGSAPTPIISGPMIASPTGMSFENPAMGPLYADGPFAPQGMPPNGMLSPSGAPQHMMGMPGIMVDPMHEALKTQQQQQWNYQQHLQQRAQGQQQFIARANAGGMYQQNQNQQQQQQAQFAAARVRSGSVSSGHSVHSVHSGSGSGSGRSSSSGSPSPVLGGGAPPPSNDFLGVGAEWMGMGVGM